MSAMTTSLATATSSANDLAIDAAEMTIEAENERLREENMTLKTRVAQLEAEVSRLRGTSTGTPTCTAASTSDAGEARAAAASGGTEAAVELVRMPGEQPLDAAAVHRYSRQMLVPSFGAGEAIYLSAVHCPQHVCTLC